MINDTTDNMQFALATPLARCHITSVSSHWRRERKQSESKNAGAGSLLTIWFGAKGRGDNSARNKRDVECN
jgi:hypothetical protein